MVALSPCLGQEAYPADMVTFRFSSNGGLASPTRETRRTAKAKATSAGVAGARMANSSPPMRKGESAALVCSVRTRPIHLRTSSPISCPKLSFTNLNRSISMRIREKWSPYRRALSASSARRSWKALRFRSPVSGSRKALSLRPEICSSAFRIRVERVSRSLAATEGEPAMIFWKSSFSRTMTFTESTLRTVALLVMEFRMAISPKKSPSVRRASSKSALWAGYRT